jgi:photosystem II stability/assembly factor-like uncharacterized protein
MQNAECHCERRLAITGRRGQIPFGGVSQSAIAISAFRILQSVPFRLGPRSVLPRLFIAALLPSAALAQWTPLTTGTTASLRGLKVVNDRVIWASGTRGTVLRSIDGGSSWAVESIPGASRMDIRAIDARNERVAHAAATAGRIWRTTDGGRTWSLRYQAADTTVFLDGIAFFDERHGLALGDPINGRFFILRTDDAGETWREAALSERPPAIAGEAAFAASGTSLITSGNRLAWIGSGGAAAHVFTSSDAARGWEIFPVPLISGASSQGVFSLAFVGPLSGVAVGGDYQRPDSARGTAAYTTDGGRGWQPASVPPRGYRSGVALVRVGGHLIAVAVGTSGSDLSTDGGRTWSPLDSTGFNAVQFTPKGIAFAVGGNGRASLYDARHAWSAPRH